MFEKIKMFIKEIPEPIYLIISFLTAIIITNIFLNINDKYEVNNPEIVYINNILKKCPSCDEPLVSTKKYYEHGFFKVKKECGNCGFSITLSVNKDIFKNSNNFVLNNKNK